MRPIIPFLLAILFAVPAVADTKPDVVADLGSVGVVYKMCDAFASTGDCTDGSDEIVLDVGGFSSVTFDFSEATTTFTCEVMGNNVGHDAASGTGQDMVATSFSGSQLAQTLPITTRFLWVTCSANAGGALTATAFGRK